MPTTRPEPHQARQVAESFGVGADRYDRTRLRYPDAAIDALGGSFTASYATVAVTATLDSGAHP